MATSTTYYEVLSVTPDLLDDDGTATLLKKAYHRALLRNHPDKDAAAPLYTIDQITQAYAVLSAPRKRADYDAQLRVARSLHSAGSKPEFQTGVENVDLDDLPLDEAGGKWYRSCRCGNEKGYLFGEEDLLEVEDEGVLLVGCQDCSLWLRVHFAVVDDGGDAG